MCFFSNLEELKPSIFFLFFHFGHSKLFGNEIISIRDFEWKWCSTSRSDCTTGYSQKPDIDYRETFALVARYGWIRMLSALATENYWRLALFIYQTHVTSWPRLSKIEVAPFQADEPFGTSRGSEGHDLWHKTNYVLFPCRVASLGHSNKLVYLH